MHKWNRTQHLITNCNSTWHHQMDHGWYIWSTYTCSSFDHSCNCQIPTHYLPHVLNWRNFKTMILNVEKFHAIKFHWLVMVSFGNTKIHHAELWIFLKWKFFYYSNINVGHPLWTFILDGHILWHMVQLKYATWYIKYILKKNQMNICVSK